MKRRSIKELLKSVEDTSTEKKKVSIADAINDACASGITEAGAFSIVGIRRKLKDLISFIDDEKFNRDDFFSEFMRLYSLVMAPDKRAVGVFHPSQLLDGCERQMAFDLKGLAPTDKVVRNIGGTLQRTFDVGTWYHIYMQSILYRIGLLEQAEVPVINRERFINGKADGVFKEEVFGEKVVLEIKTMNNWSFSKAAFKPFKKHEFQASLYARELGAKKVLYLYINKDTSEIRDFLMPINEEQLSMADKKMNGVIEYVKGKGAIPKRICSDVLCDNALNCPFATLCFEDKH